MQTFLPYRSFESSARVLDMKRLGKQRVETLQIMKSLVLDGEGLRGGWGAHPAARMWQGYEYALMTYQQVVCDEWTGRGYNDTCLEKTRALFDMLPPERRLPKRPPWLGKKVIHSIHRANLLRKAPEIYNRFNWPESPREGYWWPVRKDGTSGFIVDGKSQ